MTTSEPDEEQLPGGAHLRDDLRREFPKTAMKFEARFGTEDDCRAYWSKARWGDTPACAKCASTRLWSIRTCEASEADRVVSKSRVEPT